MTTYVASFLKDPDAVLDYSFDWSTNWLEVGETISSFTVAVDGVTKDSEAESGGTVTVFLSGGTAGTPGTCACRIVTSAGRTDERTVRLTIGER